MYNLRLLTEDGKLLCAEDGTILLTEQQLAILSFEGGCVAGGSFAAHYSVSSKVVVMQGGGIGGGTVKVRLSYTPPKFSDWLVRRLTPSKRETARWAELARALQTYWNTIFNGELERLQNLSSIYTADMDGRRRIVAELGDYFEPDQADSALPSSVAMRKLELALKNTTFPIRAAIQRLGLLSHQVEWHPLYALPTDGPYGTFFYHAGTGIPSGAYLTSRAVLMVDVGLDESIVEKISTLVAKIKPLHICYDGVVYFDTDYNISFRFITEDGDPIISEDLKNLIT